MKTNVRGFTLIELMVVVAIIGVLAAISISTYRSYISRSQTTRVQNELASLRSSIENCINDGKLILGIGVGACDPQYSGSNLMSGLPYAGATLPTAGVGYADIQNLGSAATTPVQLVATFGNQASTQIAAETLTLTRALDGSWTCSTTVGLAYKPKSC